MIIFILLAGLIVVQSRIPNRDVPAKKLFEPLVLGGERTGQGRLPFMVSLSLPPANGKRFHFCGGSLISPLHVLTAAHCLDGSPFEVRIGSNDLSMMESNSEILAVKQTIIHPEFDMYTMANDIAIVVLASPSTKQPILLSGWVALDPLGADSRGLVAGWGATNPEATRYPDAMNSASVPIVSLDQCFRLYGYTLVDTTKMCVSVAEGKDTCSGDSGGPLFIPHPSLPDLYVQLGIVSWGSQPCGSTPAVYIRVAYYSTWISAVVPSFGRPLTWFDATDPSTFGLIGGPSPTPVFQSPAPTSPRVTPFPTRRSLPLDLSIQSRTTLTPTPATSTSPLERSSSIDGSSSSSSSSVTGNCSCTQEPNRYGSTCDIHDNDPLGAWCWVGKSCSSAILTWWGAEYVYCTTPDDTSSISPPNSNTAPTVTEILLSQNWAVGISSSWKVIDQGDYLAPSAWSVDTSGKQPVLRQSSNIMVLEPRTDLPKLGTYLWYTPGVQWTDYEISLNLASTDNDILGVMFRYVDSKNYYRFSMDSQSPSSSRRLVRCLGGVFTLLASDDMPYTVGVFYLVTITVQDSHLQVMVNGQRVFDVTDNFLPTGSVALYSWADQDAIFDSVLVSRPGSVATRKLVQPIYGRAVSSQEQTQDSLDRSETTAEEGDYNFEQSTSSPQALTIGLVISLVIVLVIVAVVFYCWRKRHSHNTSKEGDLEDEQGQVTRINVIRSPPPVAVDLDILELMTTVTGGEEELGLNKAMCMTLVNDSPPSCTSLYSGPSPPPLPRPPPPPLPSARRSPLDRNFPVTPERHHRPGSPEKNLRVRSPTSRSSRLSSRLPPVPPQACGTYQPATYSLKQHQTARFSPQKASPTKKTSATMPRVVRRPDPMPKRQVGQLSGSPGSPLETCDPMPPTLRQRSPRSPEPTPPPVFLPPISPEIVMPSPFSLTPEVPAFPAADFCLPDVPELCSPPPEDPQHWRPRSDADVHAAVTLSHTANLNRSLELSPLEQSQAVRQPQVRQDPPQEVWEEIRFGDESDGSEEGLMEYFDER